MSPEKPSRPVPEAVQVRMTPIAAVGTLLWTIALVVALLLRGDLEAAGRGWWIACAATGVALGLVGTAAMAVADRRRLADRAQRTSEPSSS